MSELAPATNTVRMPAIARFVDLSSFARAAADAVAAGLSSALAEQFHAVLAVPGGSTGRTVLPILAANPLPWHRIRVTLVDERWVPRDHPDSNESLVRELLYGPAAQSEFAGLYNGAATPEAALHDLTARIPSPDVILLGMGEDGHIGSLFPGDPANHATSRFAAVRRSDHLRITLTPLALAAGRCLVLAFCGAIKQAVFEHALRPGLADELPVRHALRAHAHIFVGP
jgi:6-phosphogluconolactonase